MKHLGCFVGLVAIGLSSPGESHAETSRNPYFVAGLKLFADLDYEAAIEQLRKASSFPGNTLDDEVAIDLYLGMAQAGLGRENEADYAFRLALSLSPAAELPSNVSPKVRQWFDRVKRELSLARPAPIARTGVVAVVPQPPPESAAQQAAAAAQMPTADTPFATTRRQMTVGSWVALGAGVALAGGGAFFGVRTLNEEQAAQGSVGYDSWSTHIANARSNAWTANGMYAGAGVSVIVAAIVYLASSSKEKEQERR
jgi:hypothetical protein